MKNCSGGNQFSLSFLPPHILHHPTKQSENKLSQVLLPRYLSRKISPFPSLNRLRISQGCTCCPPAACAPSSSSRSSAKVRSHCLTPLLPPLPSPGGCRFVCAARCAENFNRRRGSIAFPRARARGGGSSC